MSPLKEEQPDNLQGYISERRYGSTSQVSLADTENEQDDDLASALGDVSMSSSSNRRSDEIEEPLPVQYVTAGPAPSSTSVSPTKPERPREGAFIGSARIGADLPPVSKQISPPSTSAVVLPIPSNAVGSASSSPSSAAGSLRSTRRAGMLPQLSPDALQSALQPSHVKDPSPPAATSAPSVLPGFQQLQEQHQQQQEEAKPALPRKPSVEQAKSKPVASVTQVQQSIPLQQSSPDWQARPAQPVQQQQHQPGQRAGAPILVQQTSSSAPSSLPSKVTPVAPAKEKEKKSGWARLGLGRSGRGDKDDHPSSDVDDASSIHSVSSTSSGRNKKDKKATKKDKDKLIPQSTPPAAIVAPEVRKAPEQATPHKEKEGGGFFGGLFGSKKRSDSDVESHRRDANGSTGGAPGTSGGSGGPMPTPPPTASGMLTADGKYVNFYRLPIHIERAVYRLSHIKLANPRRPLYEQVLISNLMFWYLGLVFSTLGW